MSDSKTERNKAIVLEAFDTLFNKRDYAAAKRLWSDRYIQPAPTALQAARACST